MRNPFVTLRIAPSQHHRLLLLGAAGLVVVASPSCARHTAAPKPVAKPAAKERVPLPDWAPANPSPEFLRAAKVLRPFPADAFAKHVGTSAEADAERARFEQRFLALYEFFGTLTDKQIGKLLSAKEIILPVKSLDKQQRAALDRYFEAGRKAQQGSRKTRGPSHDTLLMLYRMGAKKDLSNVSVRLYIASSTVTLGFRWTGPDGTVKGGCGQTFAAI